MKRAVVGRTSSPRSLGSSPTALAAEALAGKEREGDGRSRRATLAWAALALALVGLHLYTGQHIFQYLTARCPAAAAEVAVTRFADVALGGEASGGGEGSGLANLGVRSAAAASASDGGGASGAEESDGGAPKEDVPPFVLYRIIGNNMPPLQCPSQLLWNTQYALAYEGHLQGCRKRWVVNKIVNATERALLLDALLDAGYAMEDILIRPFNATEVALAPKESWLDMVTQQNEARNAAIEDGIRSGFRWILPMDGNHFITHEAWASIRASADKADSRGLRYFKIPVHRLYKEQDPTWVHAASKFADMKKHAPFMIESALAFRRDARDRFQPGMVYGQQNKLETLSRVCGTRSDSSYVPKCQCNNLGHEGQLHPSNLRIAKDCGYSLRLWFYPCNGTNAMKVFKNGMYRKKLRADSRKQMYAWVKREVQNALKQAQAKDDLKTERLKEQQ